MKYINIKSIIGTDERCWDITGERVHWSHHIFRNSPIETDSDCGNCDGARCEGCVKYTEPSHFEFSAPVDILEKAIAQAAPELTSGEISDLVYNDYSYGRIVHEGEEYRVEYPTESWLRANHNELLEKLASRIFFVEVQITQKIDDNHSSMKSCFYRFDNKEEANIFFESQKKIYGEALPDIKDSYGNDYSYYYDYNTDDDNNIKSVSILNIESQYADTIHIFWSNEVHYNDKVYHYKNGEINSITKD